MFRTAHPKDIFGLLRFAAQSTPNYAHPRHTLGEDEGRVWVSRALIGAVVPQRGISQTLLLTRGLRGGGGMATLRGHRRLSTWEVEQVLLSSDNGNDICTELLARLDAIVVQSYGLRIFMRVEDGSPALPAMAETGYRRYVTEDLYVLHEPTSDATPRRRRFLATRGKRTNELTPLGDVEVRPRRSEDDYPLFRLYTAATPVAVRAAEGLTFREWQETNVVRWQGARRLRDVVLTREGHPVGWVRTATARPGKAIAAVVVSKDDPDAWDVAIKAMLERADEAEVRILVPTYAPRMAQRLEEAAFTRERSYVSLVHQVGERVAEGAFMPAGI